LYYFRLVIFTTLHIAATKNITMKKIVSLALAVSTLIACNNSETQETVDNTNPTSTNADNNSEPQLIMEETFPGSDNGAAQNNSVSGNTSSAKLNPPHGEPGHRCEIPVGAPLDSEPTTPATTTINNTPTITPSFSAPTSTPVATPTFSNEGQQGKSSTPPGINPPHGEPGHDCAIPVGQPLKK
jgi:hypothetical protein